MATRLKIGDVFEVPLKTGLKAYIQYVCDDMTQLNSYVVRVFKKRYDKKDTPDLAEIVSDEMEFSAHVHGMKYGEKDGLIKKVGTINVTGEPEKLFFRSTNNRDVKISKEWHVWHPNEERVYVGDLKGKNTEAEIGSVLPLLWVITRIETGKYHFKYPDYK